MILTPENYPYWRPYPGFGPDDWRESVARVDSPREDARLLQLVAEVRIDHPVKHGAHEHPWCSDCEGRRRNYERMDTEDRQLSPEASRNVLRRSVYAPLTDAQQKALRTCWDNGGDERRLLQTPLFADVYPSDVEAYLDYLNREDRRYDDAQEAQRVALSRATRYLTLHRNPPVDDYDPEATSTTLAEELLDRDQLDELPEPEPLVPGVLERHAYAVLTGRDGTYKTFVALDWSLCLATGKAWQGRPVERTKVLYMAGEGAYGIAARVEAWEKAWGTKVDPEWFVVLPRAVDLFRGVELDQLLDVVTDKGLVVLDTLRRVSGRAEGNGSEMNVVIDNIEKIKRATADGTVLALAHTDKADNDSRGFSAIEDDADVVWHTKRDEDRLTLTNRKMKNAPDGEKILLRPTPSHGSLIIEAAGPDVFSGEDAASVEAILFALGTTFHRTDGATAAEIREVTGVSKSTFYRARATLLDDGRIESHGRGNATRYTLAPSQPVPTDDKPLTSTFPTSPTESHTSGPVPSRPAAFKGGTVGLTGTDDTQERNPR